VAVRRTRGPRKLKVKRVARRLKAAVRTAVGRRKVSTAAGPKARPSRQRAPARGRAAPKRRVGPTARRAAGGTGRARGGSSGFKSKAQWRFYYANSHLCRYARAKAHATAGGPRARYQRLPARKRPPSARSAR